jgi:hypothetical protein
LDWSDGWWLEKPRHPVDRSMDDDALDGIRAWIDGWRQTHPEAGPLRVGDRLMAQVGRDAVALMREGVPRTQLSRLMWAAGRDGVPLNVPAVSS